MNGDFMICVSVAASTIAEMKAKCYSAMERGAHMVEFRLDALSDPVADAIVEIARLPCRKIATVKGNALRLLSCREGLHVLSSFDFVDLDLEACTNPPAELAGRLILSHHGRIEKLEEARKIMEAELEIGTIAKCIGEAADYASSLIPLKAALMVDGKRCIGFSMGRKGTLSRIAAAHNCPFVYASVSKGEETAEGQLTLEEMISACSGHLLGILGSEEAVAHSVSPLLHAAMLKESGMDGAYLRFPASLNELDGFMEACRLAGVSGFNVTMPFKERILEYVPPSDRTARKAGAVNTVVMQQGGAEGFNTDSLAVAEVLSQIGMGSALVYGTGGAARAALAALSGWNVALTGRNPEKVHILSREFGTEVYSEGMKDFDVCLNCTPAGMDESLPPSWMEECTFRHIIDFVYSSHATPFELLARKKGADFTGGFDILCRQAAHSFRIWTGREFSHEKLLHLIRGGYVSAV